MKTFVLFTLFILTGWTASAQAPVIAGDVILCPYTNGTATITSGGAYTTYQWFYKYWFENQAPFVAIEGATAASFTYDWFTYDQALLKVVVTQGAQTFESNTIQVDSYAWTGLTVQHNANDAVTFDPNTETYLLCEGGAITNTVGSPYTAVQWYKDDVAIAGATNTTFVINQPGTYYVVAAPGFCPASTSTSLPITVGINPNCGDEVVVAPVIAGDTMLCPDTNGTVTVTNGQTYDTYQWYVNSFFTNDEFEALEGATTPSFTYDWYNYDQATFKLVVTQNGQTYESNTIFIDSYQWSPLFIISTPDEGITQNPDNGDFLICEGDSISNTIGDFFVNVQWFKDGAPIEGATENTYIITEPGSYYATASASVCTNTSNSTATQPIVAALDPECTLSINNPDAANVITLYPNPANDIINVTMPQNTSINNYQVIDVTGKVLLKGSITPQSNAINIAALSQGSYIVKLSGNNIQVSKMVIKQ